MVEHQISIFEMKLKVNQLLINDGGKAFDMDCLEALIKAQTELIKHCAKGYKYPAARVQQHHNAAIPSIQVI